MTTLALSLTVGTGFLISFYPHPAVGELFGYLQMCSGGLILISAFDYTVKGAGFLLSKLIIEKR